MFKNGSPRRPLSIASLWPEPVSTFAFLVFPHLYLALPLTWTQSFQGAPGLDHFPFGAAGPEGQVPAVRC